MNEFYWNNESFGPDWPENAEDIINSANREIDGFIERRELDPENSNDYDIICEFSGRLWDFYCQYDKLPAQAVEEDSFRVIPNAEIAQAVKEVLEARNLPASGILDDIDVGRDAVSEDLPANPDIIQQYICGFIEQREALAEILSADE